MRERKTERQKTGKRKNAKRKNKTEKEQGIIIEEIQKGYFFNNKVIRPAKVKIAR